MRRQNDIVYILLTLFMIFIARAKDFIDGTQFTILFSLIFAGGILIILSKTKFDDIKISASLVNGVSVEAKDNKEEEKNASSSSVDSKTDHPI